MARIIKLKLSIKTGFARFSGTDARIYLGLGLRNGGAFYRLPTRLGDMEAGKLDLYEAELPTGPELDEVTALMILNGMNGVNPAWRLLWARVEVVDATGHSWLLADEMVERWLDVREGAAPGVFLKLRTPAEDLGSEDVVGPTTCVLEPVGVEPDDGEA
jgi:hypothetical protein